jgi:hypothetical protein
MEAKEFFLVGHALAHAGKIVDVDGYDSSFYEDRVVNGLREDQLRQRPQGLNSIAFLLWHIARTEDVAANVVIAGDPQVFDEGEWAPRLRVARRDIGFGSTSEQVDEISAAVDIDHLRAYRLAVGRRTRALVQTLPSSAWQRVIGQESIERAIREGGLLLQWPWPREKWATQRVARLLSWPCLGHSTMHLGQAMWVRKLVLEHPSSN